jgi:aminoglycoside/choline kinase family phosphotransferase
LIDRAARDAQIVRFLGAIGWGEARRATLAEDASFRRYERVTKSGTRAVLMDAPPPQEDVRPFSLLARHLVGLGLSAPRVMAEDAEAGFLLIEDLGDETYTRMLANGGDARSLYALAVDVLVHLHRVSPEDAIPSGLPRYDEGKLLEEVCLMTDWYLPAMTGRATPPEIRAAYVAAWRAVLPVVLEQPRALVLRDFHVDNLMWLADREGVARCGLLDFQDALDGAAAYDLMSLLEDARRDVDAGLQAEMKARYRAGIGRLGPWFERAYTVLAAQRHAKVIGIFTRLCVRDGKPIYLKHIPRVWRLLEVALSDSALQPVAGWFSHHIPETLRGIPPCLKNPS